MQEDLVLKLADFGFTVNQAKVYLSIVQSGKISVGRIAKTTQLHRQDIYKLLPKLEKMGLITKTIDKPFMIEPVQIEKALERFIAKERKQSNERISHLERNLLELVNAIQMQPELKEDARFTLLTTDEAIRNKERLLFKGKRKEFLLVQNIEKKSTLNFLQDFLLLIKDDKAKVMLITFSTENPDVVKQTLQKIAPLKGHFTAKLINKKACKGFQVIDGKEVWIETQKSENDYPCILWTNDQNIVDTYKDNFRKIWKESKTTLIDNCIQTREYVPSIDDESLVSTF